MNILDVMQHFERNKQQGHTTAMLECASDGTTVLCSSYVDRHYIERLAERRGVKVNVIPAKQSASALRGLKGPLVVDHFALDTLFKEFLDQENRINTYLITHNPGPSQKAMIGCYLGIKNAPINHPEHPQSFANCCALLREAPAIRECFDEIAELSPQWAKIIKSWDVIEGYFHTTQPDEETTQKVLNFIQDLDL